MDQMTKYVTVEISAEIFRALTALASQFGQQTKLFASNLIVRGVNDLAEQNPTDPEVRLYLLANRANIQRDTRRILISIAKHLKSNPDEQSADELLSLCDHYGFDAKEIMTEAERDTGITSGGIEMASSTGVSRAVSFLTTAMELGMEYSAREMLDIASEQDIKEHWLKEARRILGVVSTRKSAGFYWKIPTITELRVRETQDANSERRTRP